MKKLSLALVVALAAFSGVAGATVASGATTSLSSPCCKVQ